MVSTNSTPNRNKQFGRRKDIHRIILAKGDQVTSLNIHPFLAFGGAFMVVVFAVGYLFATGYLMFRDDLLNSSRIHQVNVQNAYEDQLATLRIEIDRIASRQLLDQKSVENKIDRLLGLRTSLDERQRTVVGLAQSASAAGISLPFSAPTPRPHPKRVATHKQAAALIDPTTTSSLAKLNGNNPAPFKLANKRDISSHIRTTANTEILDLKTIEKNLIQEERAQAQQLHLMAKKTADSSRDIATLIRSLGFKAPSGPPHPADAIGGPFHDAASFDSLAFDHSILALQENLTHLNKLKKKVDLIPIKRPLKTGKITSQFGRRLDPFMKRYAMHSGMDFKAPTGTPVYATGPGKVVKASWNGGYGRLVEIQHAGNIVTRYAHLSRINVQVGDHVAAGKVIGRVGSTGRSTGPHLHYETRLGKKAVNPGRFIKAGIRVRSLL